MDNKLIEKSSFTVVIGSSFTMSGVNDIRGFSDGYLTLDTKSGRISVEGTDLKIESLAKDSGTIFVSGEVNGVFLSGSEEKKRGIFSKLFG